MRMRFGLLAAMAGMGMMAAAQPAIAAVQAEPQAARPKRKTAAQLAHVARKYRSRAAQAKPRKRPNMVLHGRRVRRRHRRAR